MILVTVSVDPGFHREAREALEGYLRFTAIWRLGYQDSARLRTAPDEEKYVVIVDFADPLEAIPTARAIDGRPAFASIAVGGGGTRDELLLMMQAGIRDVLPEYSADNLRQVIKRAVVKLTSTEELLGEVYSFVPAKPGCGATTIATHSAAGAARLMSEPVLLLDFDIRLGVTSFLLKAEGNHTIVDALQQSDRLDDDLWAGLVSQCGNLHLIGSGPLDFSRPVPAERFSDILRFATQKYSSVAIDLPGTMEDYETETLMRSKRIFLVCTPDIGAMHLARRKADWFQNLGLADKVAVVLNLAERRNALGVSDIERIIQLPVQFLVPSGSSEIARAVQKGTPLAGSSALAKQIGKIAQAMAEARPLAKKPSPVRRFVEYFSISAARDAAS